MDHSLAWMLGCQLTGWSRDTAGYVASGLVLATFCMQSMRWLRMTAIASNVAFIAYALAADIRPVLILHGILLPLNTVRLLQPVLRARARQAAAAA